MVWPALYNVTQTPSDKHLGAKLHCKVLSEGSSQSTTMNKAAGLEEMGGTESACPWHRHDDGCASNTLYIFTVSQIPPTLLLWVKYPLHYYCASNTPYIFIVGQIPPTPLWWIKYPLHLYCGSNTPHTPLLSVKYPLHLNCGSNTPHIPLLSVKYPLHLHYGSNTLYTFIMDQMPPTPLLWIKYPHTHTHLHCGSNTPCTFTVNLTPYHSTPHTPFFMLSAGVVGGGGGKTFH